VALPLIGVTKISLTKPNLTTHLSWNRFCGFYLGMYSSTLSPWTEQNTDSHSQPNTVRLSVSMSVPYYFFIPWVGEWRSQIIRRRESLALFKSFNTLCSLARTVVTGPCDDSVGEIRPPVFTMLWMKWTETQYACLFPSLLVAICLFKEVSHNRSRHACNIFFRRGLGAV
jgi:hypothetical protein